MPEHLGLCFALERAAVTQYRNYNFNSMAKFGEVYLGASDEGLFILDSGQDDDGTDIEAFFELPTSDWGIVNQKRIRRLYVTYETNGELFLILYDDEENPRSFILEPVHLDNKQHTARVAIGRDAKGAHWMLRIENANGSDFSVDRIAVIPIILGKKPSGA